MDTATLLPLAIEQIKFARQYLLTLLNDITDDEWFRIPMGATTHLAWQIGHVAMAEYGLCLFRQRGRKAEDLELMPSKFRKQFSRGSVPDPDPANHSSPAELLAVCERIHQQCLAEMPILSAETLAEPVDMPYAVYPNKLGSLLFCSHHEMIHAGQIGLLRRLLGKPPVR
jgi:DinB family protein